MRGTHCIASWSLLAVDLARELRGVTRELYARSADIAQAPVDERADGDVDAQLLLELAAQRVLGGLSRFDLPAGELPQPTSTALGVASGGEDRTVSFDDGANDSDDWTLHRECSSVWADTVDRTKSR